MTKDRPINIRLNRRLYDLIKKKATRLGMSFSEAVRYALTKWSEEK